MATLDTNVYKTPSFTQIGMEKDKQVKAERDFRGKEVAAGGAEKAYQAAQHKVTGSRKNVLQDGYDVFSKASIQYQKTGSDADKKIMNEAQGQLNYFAEAGMTMQRSFNDAYTEAQSNGFEGYSELPEQIQQRYQARVNDSVETKIENGKVLVKEGDTFVPAQESSYYASTGLNQNNSFTIPKAVKTGKYWVASSFTKELSGVMKSSKTTTEAKEKMLSEFQHRIESDPAMLQDVGAHYMIKDLNLIDGKQAPSSSDMSMIRERMQNPEFLEKAMQSYVDDMNSSIDNNMSGGGSMEDGYSYMENIKGSDAQVEMFTIDKVGDITGIGQAEDGSFYISKQIGVGSPTMVKAADSEVAMISKKLGYDIRQELDDKTEEPQQTEEQPQQTQEADPEVEEVMQMLPKQEEVKGTEGDGLGLGFTPQTGRAAPADASPASSEALPDWYYDNLIKFEGGVSTDKDDNAWALNPDAPKVDGKRAHTNRGVQWKVFKEYAKRNKIGANDWESEFLKMSEGTAKDIVDDYARVSGADNFKAPILRSFFTQNSWGTGKVWAADFKPGRSKEYRAVLDWLQGETGLDFANMGKMSSEEAAAIENVYNKDPKDFIKKFADKKAQHFSTLDDYDKFGKGWTRRLKELESQAIASI